MSVETRFEFTMGLKSPIMVPAGTFQRCWEHVARVEMTLGLRARQYLDNPAHWDHRDIRQDNLTDEVFCRTVLQHNAFVDYFWGVVRSPRGTEVMTPDMAQTFWHGLARLSVPVERWTGEHYRARMEQAYEVMRGRPAEGTHFDAAALTANQAAAVVILFSGWLDKDDIRLDCPVGHDGLQDGDEYTWCARCGAVDEADIDEGYDADHEWTTRCCLCGFDVDEFKAEGPVRHRDDDAADRDQAT